MFRGLVWSGSWRPLHCLLLSERCCDLLAHSLHSAHSTARWCLQLFLCQSSGHKKVIKDDPTQAQGGQIVFSPDPNSTDTCTRVLSGLRCVARLYHIEWHSFVDGNSLILNRVILLHKGMEILICRKESCLQCLLYAHSCSRNDINYELDDDGDHR